MTLEGASIAPTPQTREKEIYLIEQTWRPVFDLKPKHKETIKRYWSLKQGRDGTRALCCMCNVEFVIGQLQIHHPDHNRRNNQLSNTLPCCEQCNNEERADWLRKQYSTTPTDTASLPKSEKENTTDSATDRKLAEDKILAQTPTLKYSRKYKALAQQFLLSACKDGPRQRDKLVQDFVSYTALFDPDNIGCSDLKAGEYIDDLSLGVFAGWKQFPTVSGPMIEAKPDSQVYQQIKARYSVQEPQV